MVLLACLADLQLQTHRLARGRPATWYSLTQNNEQHTGREAVVHDVIDRTQEPFILGVSVSGTHTPDLLD